MGIRDRFSGPLSTAWPQLRSGVTARLLARPADSLPVAPASDRTTWASAALPQETLADLRERAGTELRTPWPVPLAHSYARYFRDGDRAGYEQVVFARQHRLSRAAVLAALTLDPGWIDEVADGVTLLCEQSSWCWPAHDDTRRVHGAVVPTMTDPFLDLGAGEVAAQLAWLDHLLGEQLDRHVPGVRARIRYEVDRRVLIPFASRRDWHWLGLDGDVHNWSAWIHGNVLVTALRLVDDPDRRAGLVDLVVEGLDRYVASLPPDGAIDEGYAYWWNGACRALEALDVLAHATRGALGDTVADGVRGIGALRQTVAFPHRVHLGGDWYLNHADGPARPPADQPWHALHRAARLFGDRDAAAHAAAAAHRAGSGVADESQGLGRFLRALTDPQWLAAAPGTSPLPRDTWFASTQVLLARPVAGSPAGLTLAVKGGHNGEHHNHNDVGSVVVALGGVPVLVDAGRPTYTAQTFGPDRYAIWTMRSGWHNVPLIRGSEQAPGRGYAAAGAVPTMDDTRSGLALELRHAYPRSDVRGWRRDAWLERGTGRVTIRDSWALDDGRAPGGARTPDEASTADDGCLPGGVGVPGDTPPDSAASTRVQLLAAGTVRIGAGRAEIDALDGAGTAVLTWQPAPVPVTTTVVELDDPLLRDVWGDRLTRIEIDVSALGPTSALTVTVEERR